MRKCEECTYYEQTWFEGGECRANAPTNLDGEAKWPTVKQADWCGRFAAKNSTATGVSVGTPEIQE